MKCALFVLLISWVSFAATKPCRLLVATWRAENRTLFIAGEREAFITFTQKGDYFAHLDVGMGNAIKIYKFPDVTQSVLKPEMVRSIALPALGDGIMPIAMAISSHQKYGRELTISFSNQLVHTYSFPEGRLLNEQALTSRVPAGIIYNHEARNYLLHDDNAMGLFSTYDRKKVRSFPPLPENVTFKFLQFAPDDYSLVSVDSSGMIRRWDFDWAKGVADHNIYPRNIMTAAEVTALALGADQRSAVGTATGRLRMRRSDRDEIIDVDAHVAQIHSLDFFKGQHWLLSTAMDGHLKVWNADTGTNVVVGRAPQGQTFIQARWLNSNYEAITLTNAGALQRWDLRPSSSGRKNAVLLETHSLVKDSTGLYCFPNDRFCALTQSSLVGFGKLVPNK